MLVRCAVGLLRVFFPSCAALNPLLPCPFATPPLVPSLATPRTPLIDVPGTARAAVAVLCCVLACASLNYVRPHKNRIVFMVAEMSFLLTTFKYLTTVYMSTEAARITALASANGVDQAELPAESLALAAVLIFIDVAMFVGSGVSLVAVVVLLRSAQVKHAKTLAARQNVGGEQKSAASNPTKVAPATASGAVPDARSPVRQQAENRPQQLLPPGASQTKAVPAASPVAAAQKGKASGAPIARVMSKPRRAHTPRISSMKKKSHEM